MSVKLVLTILSRDRPGVVEAVAETVATHSGNWIDSSMARLGGEFAGILRVTVPSEKVDGLRKALAGLAEKDIEITVHRDRKEAPRGDGGRRMRVSLTGLDHPGIVLEVTRCLASFDANIEELHTELFAGSMGGEAMFSAHADILLPEGRETDEMRDALEQIAQDIMVDIALEKAPEPVSAAPVG